MMKRFKIVVLMAALAMQSALAIAPARAGVFDVKPIRIFLSKDATSAILSVNNEDRAPLRLQIEGVVWNNDRSGQPHFTPTDDLIVFPTLVTINPLETRNIRIGFSGPGAEKELAYRISLYELPSLASQLSKTRTAGLEVRTRITVPVFFSPILVSKRAELDSVAIRNGAAHVVFTNTGNVHVIATAAQLVGRDASGAKVFANSIQGWYVLAGETRDFETAIPRNACSRLKSLTVTVQTDIGPFTRSVPAGPGDCSR